MSDTQLKCTTRHVRIFTALVKNNNLVPNSDHLTLDLDPDNEFIWTETTIEKVHEIFRSLIKGSAGQELNEYKLRCIGSELEGAIRQLLQAGELAYNNNCRVLNYSMGLPRSPELL